MASALALDVLAHLDAQVASARHLLDLVLAQGRSIRARDVEAVLHKLEGIQAEVERRGHLEGSRTELLVRAGQALGLPASAVTVDALCVLLAPAEAALARARSTELTGLLSELAREHGVNRALMRQELAFLAHLTRIVGGEPEGGYRPPAAAPVATRPVAARTAGRVAPAHRVLDLQA